MNDSRSNNPLDIKRNDVVWAPCFFYDTRDDQYYENTSGDTNERPFFVVDVKEDTAILRSISTSEFIPYDSNTNSTVNTSYRIKNLNPTGLKKESYVHCHPGAVCEFELNEIKSKSGKIKMSEGTWINRQVDDFKNLELYKYLKSPSVMRKERAINPKKVITRDQSSDIFIEDPDNIPKNPLPAKPKPTIKSKGGHKNGKEISAFTK